MFYGPVAIVDVEVQNSELLFTEGTGAEELQNSGSKKDTKAITEAAGKLNNFSFVTMLAVSVLTLVAQE